MSRGRVLLTTHRSDRIRGRLALNGDGWNKHLGGASRRATHKATRHAVKLALKEEVER